MYCRLFGSTNSFTPWLSNCWSPGLTVSANSSLYASPEQPDVRTPTRSPTPLPRLARVERTWLAAFSVSVITRLSSPVQTEEHTSELQSQSNLVCRLLLEKKKHNSST